MKFRQVLLIAIITTVLLAIIFVAGCTQTASTSSAPAANDQQSGNYASPGGTYSGSPGNGSNQFMQNILSNTTLLTAAASQLGVSEEDLQNALTPSNGNRPNFTAAAQQLNVTPQQLRAALGFPPGGYHGNHTYTMVTTPPGQ